MYAKKCSANKSGAHQFKATVRMDVWQWFRCPCGHVTARPIRMLAHS